MRNLLFVCALMLLSIPLSAQPDNWYFSISMGGCLPLGSFADTNPAKTGAGFALKGFTLNLDATYPLSNNWGLKGMVMLNNNPVDRIVVEHYHSFQSPIVTQRIGRIQVKRESLQGKSCTGFRRICICERS